MDDLLREFLTETYESLDRVDAELVRFEQEPNNGDILGNIFRLVHTIKGTCGFLSLPRLEALAHAAENLMGEFRDGMPVTTEAVTLVLSTIDRIKTILDELETHQREPTGHDADLIGRLNRLARRPDRGARSSTRQDARPAPTQRERADAGTSAPVRDTSPASAAERADAEPGERVASQSIRVNVEDTRPPHDHRFGAGADPQPAPRNRPPARGL
jgi:two-component system chemotaxis sensor kinase CheA